MPKPLKKPVHPKRPSDPNEWARQLVRESTEEQAPEPTPDEISRVMAVLGRKVGKIGGKRRLETMTSEERSQAAMKAAQIRWKQVKAAKRG